jgi:2-keto-4-pentenoate hydratase
MAASPCSISEACAASKDEGTIVTGATQHDALATCLVGARRAGTGRFDAALVPPDAEAAMQVQRDVAARVGARIGGWKVGFGPDGVPFAAPLYAADIVRSPATRRLAPGEHVIVEVELAFRLARDLPPGDTPRDEILAAIDEALIGIELIRGRLGEPPAVPFLAFLADNAGNDGYVTGASSRDFRSRDLSSLRCRLDVDGTTVHDKVGGHPQGDPLEPVRAYLARANDALGGLRAGHVVTTGSFTAPIRAVNPGRFGASIDGIGEVRLELAR